MAVAYARVLLEQGVPFLVIGRSESRCRYFKEQVGVEPVAGGLDNYLTANPIAPDKAIVAVGVEALADVSTQLINYGVSHVLIEKPGMGAPAELAQVVQAAQYTTSTALLAYNRRYYASVLKAEEIIEEDGGVESFCFEFTEWSHVIGELDKTAVEHRNWFLGNSSHVVDLAFFLCGKPLRVQTFVKGGLDWHPASAVFTGAGETDKEALFSYHANWKSPGRWWLEILTSKRRLIFRPLEKLQVQNIGSVEICDVPLDDDLDKMFKPGLFLQVQDFVNGKYSRFVTIDEQAELLSNVYLPMSGYSLAGDD